MVPTEFKAMLSKRLSYPLGAAAVSEAVSGVPQYEQLRLWFSDHPGTSAIEFQQVLREGTPYVVLQVAFKRWSMNLSGCNWMITNGWYDKKWQIIVYPVLREHRHAARDSLLRHALPAMKR